MHPYFFLVTLSVILTLDSVQSGPPQFDTTYETKEINEGSRASVLCIATNDSPIKYKWYNKQFGEEVSDKASSDVKTSETQEGSRLIFDPVSSSHEGIYTCTAENQHGLVSKVYQIVVNSGNVTENVTCSVKIMHVTESSVGFLFEDLDPTLTYRVEFFEKIKTNKTILYFEDRILVFNELIPSGQYTFNFQALSSTNETVWTQPYEVVLLPYTPDVMIRSFSGNALQMEWSNKLDDFRRGTIDSYSVSYGMMRRATYDTWEPIKCFINVEIPTSCYSSTKYTIADLSQNTYYEIRLRAHTKAGYGKPFVTKVHVV